jgi:hypothetical protein
MRQRAPALLTFVAGLLWLVTPTGVATADDLSNYKTSAGLSVYLGVVPAAMVRSHPKGHPEEAMHDGVPGGPHSFHVMAAVFDAKTGYRVEDAVVEARVSPVGLAGVARRLNPMVIADTVTYGNYFMLRRGDVYRIAVTITRPAAASPVTMEFSYEHER